jgi:hypothetical protein
LRTLPQPGYVWSLIGCRSGAAIKQILEDFARYLYLPRLCAPAVLLQAIRDGLGLLTWRNDSFAYAESFDDTLGRYRGLRCGQMVNVTESNLTGLLVRPEVALKQHQAETTPPTPDPTHGNSTGDSGGTAAASGSSTGGTEDGPERMSPVQPKRFHGSVVLDSTRVGRDAGRIADEVIAHLAGLVGSTVKVTLEIEAQVPSGAPDNVVRTVTENSLTLKFTTQGFERE